MKRVLEIINENDLNPTELLEIIDLIRIKMDEHGYHRRMKRGKLDSTRRYEKAAEEFKDRWFVRANNKILNENDKISEYIALHETFKTFLEYEKTMLPSVSIKPAK